MKKILTCLLIWLATCPLYAEGTVEILPYGDMDSWTVRYIKESRLLGGKTRTLYMMGPVDTTYNQPFEYLQNGNIWANSNAYAKVVGVEKGAESVYAERRGDGFCCRMETQLQTVTALGIDLKALQTGTIFAGELADPMTLEHTYLPLAALNQGIPFTRCPKAMVLDYKAKICEEDDIVYANAGAKVKHLPGHDEAEVYIILQKRWEDEKGRIHALRVGTGYMRIGKSVPEWQNDYRLPIYYGDIRNRAEYKDYMCLKTERWMAKNSKGKMQYIVEEGWAPKGTRPTHVLIQLAAGCQVPFQGQPGNILWVDNIGLEY